MMQHFLRRQLDRAAELEMSYLSTTPGLKAAVVVDDGQTIRFSTRLEWVAMKLEDSPLRSEAEIVKRVRASLTTVIQRNGRNSELKAVYPFFPAYDSIQRGAVLLLYDAAPLLRQARADALRESVTQTSILLALTALLWLALDAMIANRVNRIVAFARAFAKGESPPTPLTGNDELASISQQFAEAVSLVRETDLRLLDAAEKERLRMGGDLHDDVCQRITAAQLRCGVLESFLAREGSAHAGLAQQVAEELAKAATVTRGFARGLVPVAMGQDGVEFSVCQAASFIEDSFGIPCSVECDLGGVTLPEATAIHLYRIVQELATNAAKHAKASWIRIALHVSELRLRAEVEYDGEFFDGESSGEGRLGMSLVRQRVRALNGELRFLPRAEKEKGTLVLFDAKLPSLEVSQVNEFSI
jgi:signal transduction histidine kinase